MSRDLILDLIVDIVIVVYFLFLLVSNKKTNASLICQLPLVSSLCYS